VIIDSQLLLSTLIVIDRIPEGNENIGEAKGNRKKRRRAQSEMRKLESEGIRG
jgi:hypothetical protein